MTGAMTSADQGSGIGSLGARLAEYVVLAHDPAVPAVAADWWEISEPHYLSVVRPLADFVAGERADAALAALVASPTDRRREIALGDSLDPLLERDPAARSRFTGLLAAADAHVLVRHHRGTGVDHPAAEVTVDDTTAWLRPRPEPGPGPRALVVIALRDRTGGARVRNLLACLAALHDQRRADHVAITVVESDDEPRWRAVVQPWVDHYFFAPHGGHFSRSWAVNVGVRQTPGSPELICVLDADILVDQLFLERNLGRFDRPEAADMIGLLPYRSMFCLDPASTHTAIRRRCELREPDVPLDPFRALVLREPVGACLWIRASAFRQVGGFDERYQGWGGEDDDLFARLERVGPLLRFDDPLLHMSHPRPQMTLDGRPFNAHIEPLSWDSTHGYGDLRGPAVGMA